MTHAQVRAAIERVLGTVPCAPPVGFGYCEKVRDALREQLPGAQLDVYHRLVELVVEARVGNVWEKLVVPVV